MVLLITSHGNESIFIKKSFICNLHHGKLEARETHNNEGKWSQRVGHESLARSLKYCQTNCLWNDYKITSESGMITCDSAFSNQRDDANNLFYAESSNNVADIQVIHVLL